MRALSDAELDAVAAGSQQSADIKRSVFSNIPVDYCLRDYEASTVVASNNGVVQNDATGSTNIAIMHRSGELSA